MMSLPLPLLPCSNLTPAPNFSERSVSRRRMSGSTAFAVAVFSGASESRRRTRRSVSRTDKPFATTSRAAALCAAPFRHNKNKTNKRERPMASATSGGGGGGGPGGGGGAGGAAGGGGGARGGGAI